MEKLDFVELHTEKANLIFDNISILSEIKESNTILPPEFFKEVNSNLISDYKAKMGILNKNTKFTIKEMKKDFKLLRKIQKKQQAANRRAKKQKMREQIKKLYNK